MKSRTTLLMSLSLSLVAAGYIVASVHHRANIQGFTLHITQTAYPIGREPILSATKTRYQKADGSFKLETTYSNGRIDTGFGEVGRGVFRVDEEAHRLEYLSELSARQVTDDALMREPGFAGEEMILGYKTFHIHSNSEVVSGDYADFYLSPQLQGYPLRAVYGSRDGSKTVFEVTEVKLGEPSFSPPNYPVDTTRYEQVHGTSPNASKP